MSATEPRPRLTPGQRARVARAIEQARAAQAHRDTDRRRARSARRDEECDLAERLLEHIADESIVDRAAHALRIARVILDARSR